MNLRIELHDAVIETILQVSGDIEVLFSSIPILRVTDEFGLAFDQTYYKAGKAFLTNAVCSSLPVEGDLNGGCLLLGESRIQLIPTDCKVKSPCALELEQNETTHRIFADEIRFEVYEKTSEQTFNPW